MVLGAADRGCRLAGILVLRHPLLAAFTVPTVIVIVLGVQALIMGVLEIIGGFTGGGIIGAALALPLVFGVLLLIQGIACVILAFRVRAA
jgi:uncharacterized membrane protein HdeD (DUF308 family)